MNNQWKLVPVEPTETMVINGFESVPNECFTDEEVWEQYQEMSGCQQAAFRAKLCWAAMIGAAPALPDEDAQPVMKLEAERLKAGLVAWSYCPECGCQEMHHEEGEHKQCANCHQEWFSDIDYSEVVRGNIAKLKASQPAPASVVLPERMTREQALELTDYPPESAMYWYNKALDDVQACLDKVKELNPRQK